MYAHSWFVDSCVMAVVGIEIMRERLLARYSTAGTVHEMAAARARERRLGFWAPGTPAVGLRPRPARGKGFPSNLLHGVFLMPIYPSIPTP